MVESEENTNEEKEEKYPPLYNYSANKVVYLIRIEGSPIAYVTAKLELGGTYIRITGHELEFSKIAETKTLADAEKNADRTKIYDIIYPWHKIHSIDSLTFNKSK